jgi:hypothetical protein
MPACMGMLAYRLTGRLDARLPLRSAGGSLDGRTRSVLLLCDPRLARRTEEIIRVSDAVMRCDLLATGQWI